MADKKKEEEWVSSHDWSQAWKHGPHAVIWWGFMVIGLIVAGIAGFAVWLQTVLVLFGPKDLRFELMTLEWPEDMEAKRQLRATAEEAVEDVPGT